MIECINEITKKLTSDCKSQKSEYFRVKHIVNKINKRQLEISIFDLVQNEQVTLTLFYRLASPIDILVSVSVPKINPSFEVVLNAEVLHSLLVGELKSCPL